MRLLGDGLLDGVIERLGGGKGGLGIERPTARAAHKNSFMHL